MSEHNKTIRIKQEFVLLWHFVTMSQICTVNTIFRQTYWTDTTYRTYHACWKISHSSHRLASYFKNGNGELAGERYTDRSLSNLTLYGYTSWGAAAQFASYGGNRRRHLKWYNAREYAPSCTHVSRHSCTMRKPARPRRVWAIYRMISPRKF